jgi:hypothetical protein
MKTKKITKKLVLNKKTVSDLDKLEQSNVKGGIWHTILNTCRYTFCYDNSCLMGVCGP